MCFNYALLSLPVHYTYPKLKNVIVLVLFLYALITNNKLLKLPKWQQLAKWQLYIYFMTPFRQ